MERRRGYRWAEMMRRVCAVDVLECGHCSGRRKVLQFLAANDIVVAGVEFIVDAEGEAYTYDVNTNTNYNPEAEAEAGLPGRGMGAIADFLCAELARETGVALPRTQAAE